MRFTSCIQRTEWARPLGAGWGGRGEPGVYSILKKKIKIEEIKEI
jgi:hypothetical protein